jgi:Protein of unknown function (DUF3108)
MRRFRLYIATLVLAGALPAAATELNCNGSTNVESFRYTWRMRGGLSWVAGIVFPTSGVGELKTTYGTTQGIASSLLITAPSGTKGGFYAYESQMDDSGQKTLMTYHAYAWRNKSRKERTLFDYVKRLAHVHKETPEKQWDSTKSMPTEDFRDILTAIYYIRQNAATIRGPVQTTIFSDGKSYPVIFRPSSRQVFNIEGKQVAAQGFEIVDAPGGRKWPGGVKVWLSDDARRIPFRIEIVQSMASMQLDLQSIDACAFMQAAK